MLATRCNTPTRHWLLLLGLPLRMTLVNPVAALAPHSQASKRKSGLQQKPRRPGLIDLSHWTSDISRVMDGDQLSVDCPGCVPRGPAGMSEMPHVR